MLSIKSMKGGGPGYYLEMAQVSYYDPEVSGEPPGYWHGSAAKEFGLSGEVLQEHLERLCEGFHPEDPEKRLVRNAGRHEGRTPRDPGFDATFSAPKSFSVLWAASDDGLREQLERAEMRAVKQALDYLESQAVARTGAQGQTYEKCPLLFAVFRQASSRAGDAQIHSHCLCVNVTMHADGRTSAIDTSHLFFFKMAAGALYRATLAKELVALGFDIEADGSSFHIGGVPKELCEDMSKRRQEIKDILIQRFGSLEASDAIFAAGVAKNTRSRKEEKPRAEMLRVWQAIAEEFGLTLEAVESIRREARSLSPASRAMNESTAFWKGINALSETHAHWSERELVQHVAQAAQVHALSAKDVLDLVEEHLSQPDQLVPLGELVTEHKSAAKRVFKERRDSRFSTPEILSLEREMMADGARLNQLRDETPRTLIEEGIATEPDISDEQKEAVRSLLTGGKLRILVGDAGTGKTYVMNAVRAAFEAQGAEYRVLGCSLAAIAGENLNEKSGIPSSTVAHLLIRLKKGAVKLDSKTLLVIDEAGMLGTKPLAELLRFAAKAKARVILCGDPKQLQPITQGGPLRHFIDEYGAARLKDIRRQREHWHREAVKDFARGDAAEALQAFVKHKQLRIAENRDEAMQEMVQDWKDRGGIEKPQEAMFLTGLRVEAHALNQLCQEERLRCGALGPGGIALGEKMLYPGDRVLLTRNNKKLGVKNGYQGEVVSIDEQSRTLIVRLDNGRTLGLPVDGYASKHLDLGYAATTHKVQGATLERVYVLLGGPLSDRHMAYVQASRSRGECRLYIDKFSAGKNPTLKLAARSLSRERSKNLAHDILKGSPAPSPSPDQHRGHSSLSIPSPRVPSLSLQSR